MPDYPDYTKPITITGVTIETLPIDIKAQTVGNIAIDIAAQTVGNINIDIGLGLKDLATFQTFLNPGAEEDLHGWDVTGTVLIDTDHFFTGVKGWKFPKQPGGAQMSQHGLRPFSTDDILEFTIAVEVEVEGDSVLVYVWYTDGDLSYNVFTPEAGGSWEVHAITTKPGKQVCGIDIVAGHGAGDAYVDTLVCRLKTEVYVGTAADVNLNVDITAQTIGNLGIDIKAQTLGQLNVNIAASAVTLNVAIQSSAVTLDINIASSAVTLNIKTAVGEHVDTDIVSSVTLNVDIVAQTVGNISIDIAAQTVGNINVNIAAQAANVNVNIAASAVTIDINVTNAYLYIRTEALQNPNVDIAAQTVGNLAINLAQNTLGNLTVDIAAQTLGQVNVNIAASAVTVNVDVQNAYFYVRTEAAQSLRVDIVAQTVGNLAVDIAAQTVGNISIDIAAQTVGNLNVDIKAQTVDLNIKTSGGVNLVIDKLTQTAYVEDRRTLSNNGETASWTGWATGDNRHGKFFPRGCRGFIYQIPVYCKDVAAAGGTITVYLSPHPSMGYIASADITVPAEQSADWLSATFNRFWNYDSMFIFIKVTADIQYAYDAGPPDDQYASSDVGATWTHGVNRMWFRAVMKAMTAGDLPVSGTINTINIPATSDERITDVVSLTQNVLKVVKTVYGAGHAEYILLIDPAQAASEATLLMVYCDGKMSYRDNFSGLSTEGCTPSTPKTSLLNYAVDGYCAMLISIRFEFQREFSIRLLNGTADQVNVSVSGLVNLIR